VRDCLETVIEEVFHLLRRGRAGVYISGDWSYSADNYRTRLSSDMQDPCGMESVGLVRRRCVYGRSLTAHVL
jgi:hypothetical protein